MPRARLLLVILIILILLGLVLVPGPQGQPGKSVFYDAVVDGSISA
jgi:hypothetical protein